MTSEARILRIARESLELEVAPNQTPSFRADPDFALDHSGEIWTARAAIRDGHAYVYVPRAGRRKEEPEVEPDEVEPDDEQDDPEDDEREHEGDEAGEVECRCSCEGSARGDCASCSYADDPAECEDREHCLCGESSDDEADDEADDEG